MYQEQDSSQAYSGNFER